MSELSPALAARLRALPRVGDAGLAAAEPLGEGWSTRALRVGRYAVRLPADEAAASSLAGEARLVRALSAAQVLGVPSGARVLRANGSVLASAHRLVEGTPARGEVLHALRGRRRERLARDVAAFLTALHGFPASRARGLGVSERELWTDIYAPLIEACRPHLGRRTTEALYLLTTRFLAAGGSARASRVLIHGDLSGDHILLGPSGRLTGVIDFGEAAIADPALDIAGLLNDFRWPFVERVLARYEARPGVRVDRGLRRRAAFYITVAPLYSVLHWSEAGVRAQAGVARRRLATRVRAALAAGSTINA